MKRFFFFMLTAGILLLAGCNKVNTHGNFVLVDSITLNQTDATLSVGGTLDLTATVTPKDASNATVKWESTDDKVASVDAGKVTALKTGLATIKAKAGGKEASCKITVVDKIIPVTGVSVTPSDPTVGVGGTVVLTARLTPSNATNHNVSWVSKNTDVATVDNKGVVTGRSRGQAQVTVTTEDGNKTASVTVKVVQPITDFTITAPNSSTFDVDNDAFVMTVGETCQIQTSATPSTHDDSFEYTVQSGGSDYLSVSSSGLISAGKQSAGKSFSVNVKARAGGVSRSVKVSVWDKPTDITLLQGGDVNDIGRNASQVYVLSVTPSTAYAKRFSIAGWTGDMTYSMAARNGKDALFIKAPNAALANTSSKTNTVSSTVTLQTGSKSAPFTKSIQFILTYYDPFEAKPGDVITCSGNKMIIRDGGYRGNGIHRSGLKSYWSPNFFDVAILACVTDFHLTEDPALNANSFTGADAFYAGDDTFNAYEYNTGTRGKLHGIAIPCNTTGLKRTTDSPWEKTDGEKWQGEHANVNPDGYSSTYMSPSSLASHKHTAFYNTAGLLKYSNSGKESRDVRPIIYCSSDAMKTYLKVSSLRYANYYYDSNAAAGLINRTCTSGGSTRISARWDATKCSPWLLPTVADMLSVLSGNSDTANKNEVRQIGDHITALESTLKVTTEDTSISLYNESWWTSQQMDTDNAWWVFYSGLSSKASVEKNNKTNVASVLPILYF